MLSITPLCTYDTQTEAYSPSRQATPNDHTGSTNARVNFVPFSVFSSMPGDSNWEQHPVHDSYLTPVLTPGADPPGGTTGDGTDTDHPQPPPPPFPLRPPPPSRAFPRAPFRHEARPGPAAPLAAGRAPPRARGATSAARPPADGAAAPPPPGGRGRGAGGPAPLFI